MRRRDEGCGNGDGDEDSECDEGDKWRDDVEDERFDAGVESRCGDSVGELVLTPAAIPGGGSSRSENRFVSWIRFSPGLTI